LDADIKTNAMSPRNMCLLGRILFFRAVAHFGIQHSRYATLIAAPLLGPPRVPAGRFLALTVGAASLLLFCASATTQKHVQASQSLARLPSSSGFLPMRKTMALHNGPIR
jgi:hypothetical protein